MRLLYLPTYFAPEHAASSYLAMNRIEAFANAGFDVEMSQRQQEVLLKMLERIIKEIKQEK